MAKKKATGLVESTKGADDYTPSVYLDVKALSDLKGLEVGEVVTVIIKGKVKGLSQREDYGDSSKVKGELQLYPDDIQIEAGTDVWDELSKEDD
jgi:hypothetical protein